MGIKTKTNTPEGVTYHTLETSVLGVITYNYGEFINIGSQ